MVAGGRAARRLCVLAVLAPLSVAATVGLVRPDGSPLQQAGLAVPPAATDAITLPQVPSGMQAPASVTHDAGGSTTGLGVAVDVRALATDAIPARALIAYQRAEAVMREADASCNLSWQLVAAIGKVESNHGRFGGALMTEDGVVHPAILGSAPDRGTRHVSHHRHRRRAARWRQAGRPCRRSDAVHPVDLVGRWRGRRR